MTKIRISGTEFSLGRRAFEIYVQGCFRGCKGCHNPETQPSSGGEEVDIREFLREQKKKTDEFGDLVQNIYVTGGDLLCHTRDLVDEFSKEVAETWPDKIRWLFTGDKYNDIRDVVWLYYDIVKCGPYLQHRRLPEGVFPASDNQELVFNRFCPCLPPDKRLERLDKLDRIYKEIEFRGAKFWRDGSHGT